ncbi:hypothetical protein O982_14470 [Mycobacterium avium 10-5581]|nr:hypothetical protein O982_14470 [Mycobacterium avium 10-5581]
MGSGDEAWHVPASGDLFFNEQRQKLVVLVGVGGYCAGAHNCGAG